MSWYKYKDGTTLIGWILVALLGGLVSLGFILIILALFGESPK